MMCSPFPTHAEVGGLVYGSDAVACACLHETLVYMCKALALLKTLSEGRFLWTSGCESILCWPPQASGSRGIHIPSPPGQRPWEAAQQMVVHRLEEGEESVFTLFSGPPSASKWCRAPGP